LNPNKRCAPLPPTSDGLDDDEGIAPTKSQKWPTQLALTEIPTLQDLTVLPTEFFRRRKTHIPSVINLPTKSPMKMLRR